MKENEKLKKERIEKIMKGYNSNGRKRLRKRQKKIRIHKRGKI